MCEVDVAYVFAMGSRAQAQWTKLSLKSREATYFKSEEEYFVSNLLRNPARRDSLSFVLRVLSVLLRGLRWQEGASHKTTQVRPLSTEDSPLMGWLPSIHVLPTSYLLNHLYDDNPLAYAFLLFQMLLDFL